MKISLSFVSSLLLIMMSDFSFGQESAKLGIGMTQAEFSAILPGVIPQEPVDQKQFLREDTINGLAGSWSYDFKNGLLDRFAWHSYTDEISEENFNKCLSVTQQLIGKYRKLYGEPIKTEDGNLAFRDPGSDHHWGYEVKNAWWETEKMKIHINFDFFGGKGEYHFIVLMEFDKL